MEKISKEFLGLAGEYAVANELCKRGIYAQLTLGHHKSTDILVETESHMLRIQVKAKQNKEWPSITGISKKNNFLVLVDLLGKQVNERPDFYILNVKDWKRLVYAERKRYPDVKIDDELCIKYSDGWKGLNIKPRQVYNCKDAWYKITRCLQNE